MAPRGAMTARVCTGVGYSSYVQTKLWGTHGFRLGLAKQSLNNNAMHGGVSHDGAVVAVRVGRQAELGHIEALGEVRDAAL